MKIYSTTQIKRVSLLITMITYLFVFFYLPKLCQTIHEYVYYQSQPNIEQEYEEVSVLLTYAVEDCII